MVTFLRSYHTYLVRWLVSCGFWESLRKCSRKEVKRTILLFLLVFSKPGRASWCGMVVVDLSCLRCTHRNVVCCPCVLYPDLVLNSLPHASRCHYCTKFFVNRRGSVARKGMALLRPLELQNVDWLASKMLWRRATKTGVCTICGICTCTYLSLPEVRQTSSNGCVLAFLYFLPHHFSSCSAEDLYKCTLYDLMLKLWSFM